MPAIPTIATPTVTLVGESNPYGGDEEYALYPSPDGCSGHRLCCLILAMRRTDYLREFDRVNLCVGPWRLRDARTRAQEIRRANHVRGGKLVLLGAKVCKAFGVEYAPFTADDVQAVLPHPSGLCRTWNLEGAYEGARVTVAKLAPHLTQFLGKADDDA